MKIYNPNNELIIDTPVDDDSVRLKEIMGENNLTLRFSLPEFIKNTGGELGIPTGSWCEFKGERYMLLAPENFTKQHTEHYDYILTMEAWAAYLKYVKFKFFTVERNPGEPDRMVGAPKIRFSLTATPEDFARLMVDNMNFSGVTGWEVGECVESDPVTIDFNMEYCSVAVQKIADTFNTEWEMVNKTLHFRKVERRDNFGNRIFFPLSYGYNNGALPGITRKQFDDSKVINRLWIQGGDRNIDLGSYGNDTLLLPKDTLFEYEDIQFRTDETGSYVEAADRSGALSEDGLDVSKVYPKRVGTVTEVIVVDDSKGFYDFTDTSVPDTLDFAELMIPGETMTVIFQDGQLAGQEFEVKYIHNTRKFQIKPNTDSGRIYPQGTIIPAVGDKYGVFHMSLPQEYIDSAETEARDVSVKYLYENMQPKYTYEISMDGIYAKQQWGAIGGLIAPGYFVRFSDPQFLPEPVDIRIVSVKEYVNMPQKPVIEISNNVTGKSLSNVLAEIPAQEQGTDRKDGEVVKYAKRRFRDVQETISMLEESQLHFDNSINPITVQTMALLVGDESLQFRFVDSRTDPQPVVYNIEYNPAEKKLYAPGGIVQHMTLGIDNISSSHAPGEYKFWDMAAWNSDALTDAGQGYYLYAKVERNGTQGSYLISPVSIAMDADPDYYHLLAGILNSEFDNDRSFATLYGFTEILPGRITTDSIVSSNGNSFFDLLNNRFKMGDNTRYLAWNVVTGLLEIMNADIVANGKFSTKAPSDGFRLDLEGPNIDVFSLSESINVGRVEGSILLSQVNSSGQTVAAPTAIFNSDWGDNAKLRISGASFDARSSESRRVSIDWSDARAADYYDFLIYIIKGLPQMDDPTGVLESGQLYLDMNYFLKITP